MLCLLENKPHRGSVTSSPQLTPGDLLHLTSAGRTGSRSSSSILAALKTALSLETQTLYVRLESWPEHVPVYLTSCTGFHLSHQTVTLSVLKQII